MCLLCFIPPNETPKEEHLLNACKNNPDGFGFAFLTTKGFVVERSMTYPELVAKFYRTRKKYPDAPALFHARLATHGTKNLDNCHPFYVAGNKDILLAHNGILPVHIAENDTRSDTKVFAEDYLKHLGIKQLDSEIGFNILEQFCSGSKLVILNRNPSLAYSWYIINELAGDWDKKDQCWYSNSGYKSSNKYQRSSSTSIWGTYKSNEQIADRYSSLVEKHLIDEDEYCTCHGRSLWEMSRAEIDLACSTCPALCLVEDDEDEVKSIHSVPLSQQLEI